MPSANEGIMNNGFLVAGIQNSPAAAGRQPAKKKIRRTSSSSPHTAAGDDLLLPPDLMLNSSAVSPAAGQPPPCSVTVNAIPRVSAASPPSPPVAAAGVEHLDPQEEEQKFVRKATFGELGLNKWLCDSLNALGIKSPSEIQESCIPQIINGKDIIGSAKTGSGKTAAFALPIIQKLNEDPFGVFALVLTPTRELAFQIAEQFRVLGSGMNLKQAVIVGGMDMMKQALELSSRPHIVIATPGRLVDHINSSSNCIHFKRLKFLVLDEADRMLEDTFSKDLQFIINELPKKRQTLLFSATITKDIEDLQNSMDVKPFVYKSSENRYEVVSKLDQKYIFIPSAVRDAYLTLLLRTQFSSKTIILFTSKCQTCERLRIMLKELGFKTTALHSEMSQGERISSLAKFKSGIVKILLATDVGSRGLDIPSVQVVMNYEIPADATDYVHRVGRTARAGRGGFSLSFVSERDIDVLLNIEKKINKKLEELKVVENDALELLNEVGLARKVATMHLMDTNFGLKSKVNREKRELKNSRVI